jgi:hypothetical protein
MRERNAPRIRGTERLFVYLPFKKRYFEHNNMEGSGGSLSRIRRIIRNIAILRVRRGNVL